MYYEHYLFIFFLESNRIRSRYLHTKFYSEFESKIEYYLASSPFSLPPSLLRLFVFVYTLYLRKIRSCPFCPFFFEIHLFALMLQRKNIYIKDETKSCTDILNIHKHTNTQTFQRFQTIFGVHLGYIYIYVQGVPLSVFRSIT